MIMAPNRMDSRMIKVWFCPVNQIRRDSMVTPKDFRIDTITVAMMPPANPTL